ncbi:response regulator [Pseudogracilibacillus sp. SE30717A]|uniref:response regulator n=1 Tax=Pseudogracilibacillus sp. SE30717A TaxID=3098293 RepID=UPI00300E4621
MAKVLIIDDAKFMRMTLSNLFQKNNFSIVGMAENGVEGVDLYKKTSPDLVTLDITMPVMDGLQALKEILSFDPTANVIMCSAMGQQKLVVEAIELGAKDFIVKPFDEQRVMETVHQIIHTSI